MVYIREAHAADGKRPIKNDPVSNDTKEPKDYDDRLENASTCVEDLGIELPCLIDDMKNGTDGAYSGWPDRLFVVDVEGKIAFRGEPGPRGFDPKAMEKALKELLEK